MFEFAEPAPVTVTFSTNGKPKEPRPLSLGDYLTEIVMTLPYWRSSAVAARQGEEVFACIDSGKYRLPDVTREALLGQMRLADSTVIVANPHLARASLRFLIVVEEAPKVTDGE